MRKQIAAANWKMNLTFQQGEKLLDDILRADIRLKSHRHAVFAVPFPYLLMARSEVEEETNYYVAAQNCYHKKNGAFTGEVSAEMLHSLAIPYCIIGHSERREHFHETNAIRAHLGHRHREDGHQRPGPRNACVCSFYSGKSIWARSCGCIFYPLRRQR